MVRYGRGTTDFAATNPDDSRGNVPNGLVYRSLKSGYYVTKTFSSQTDLTGEFETGSLKHAFDLGLEFSNIKQDKDGYTETGLANGTSGCVTGTSNGKNVYANPALCTSLWDPDPNASYPGHLQRNNNPARYNTDTVALYAFDTIKFNDQWQASLGARWDNYRTGGSSNIAKGRNDPTGTPDFYSTSREDNLFNYQLGLAYAAAQRYDLRDLRHLFDAVRHRGQRDQRRGFGDQPVARAREEPQRRARYQVAGIR